MTNPSFPLLWIALSVVCREISSAVFITMILTKSYGSQLENRYSGAGNLEGLPKNQNSFTKEARANGIMYGVSNMLHCSLKDKASQHISVNK